MDNDRLISERLQRLLCLGLDGTPAAELIPGTLSIWKERFRAASHNRLLAAFENIETHATRWPTPAAIFEAMPTYTHTYEPAPAGTRQIAVDPEREAAARDRVNKMIEQCAAKLGFNVGSQDPD